MVSPNPICSVSGLPQTFVFSRHAFLLKGGVICKYVLMFCGVLSYFGKHQIDAVQKEFWNKKMNFDLSFHLDPIGDQTYVQELTGCCVHLAYLVFIQCTRTYIHIYIYIYLYISYILQRYFISKGIIACEYLSFYLSLYLCIYICF